MRKSIKLRTGDGKLVALHLDNWGGGVDRLYRRWVREADGGWRCVETGAVGYPPPPGILSFAKPIPRWRT